MKQTHEPRPSETALIIFVALLLGVIFGGIIGFYVGKNSNPTVLLPAVYPTIEPTIMLPTSELQTPTLIVAVPTHAQAIPTSDPISTTTELIPSAIPTISNELSLLEGSTPISQIAIEQAETPIPIPQARTPTPPPLETINITIDDQTATDLAKQAAGSYINEVQVHFTNGFIELRGTVIVPFVTNNGALFVRGKPQIESPNLRVRIEEATVDGVAAPQDVVKAIESVMNNMFRSTVSNRKVEQIDVGEGQITIMVTLPTE